MRNSYNKIKLDEPISQIYFWNKTLHVSDSSSDHHQGVLYCTPSSVLILLVSCQQTCMTYTIAVCTVKNPLMMEKGIIRNKQSFIAKNKFEKLVHLVGFIVRTKKSSRIERTNIAMLFITLLGPKLIYTSYQHFSCASTKKQRSSATKHQPSNFVYINYRRSALGTNCTWRWRHLELFHLRKVTDATSNTQAIIFQNWHNILETSVEFFLLKTRMSEEEHCLVIKENRRFFLIYSQFSRATRA